MAAQSVYSSVSAKEPLLACTPFRYAIASGTLKSGDSEPLSSPPPPPDSSSPPSSSLDEDASAIMRSDMSVVSVSVIQSVKMSDRTSPLSTGKHPMPQSAKSSLSHKAQYSVSPGAMSS